MNGPVVILLGPMGAGKTSVGRELAARLGVAFADLDELIVEETGCSITETFSTVGEAGFRTLEADVLAHTLRSHPGVLALGGGAVMHHGSRELLRERPVVMLDIDETTAARRLGQGQGRPMLSGQDAMARWRELAAERRPVYQELATWQVDARAGDASAVARTIDDLMQHDRRTAPRRAIP